MSRDVAGFENIANLTAKERVAAHQCYGFSFRHETTQSGAPVVVAQLDADDAARSRRSG